MELITIIQILLITVAIFLIGREILKSNIFENYENGSSNNLATTTKDLLLKDTYPVTGSKIVSENNSTNTWYRYPIFEVGSYNQLTNNFKNVLNPDEYGKCSPVEMCGALYNDAQIKTNIITPLPPVEESSTGVRVGYFHT